jgi:hypothetical protein
MDGERSSKGRAIPHAILDRESRLRAYQYLVKWVEEQDKRLPLPPPSRENSVRCIGAEIPPQSNTREMAKRRSKKGGILEILLDVCPVPIA